MISITKLFHRQLFIQATMNIANLRKPYRSPEDSLLEESLPRKNPHIIFDEWLKLACETPGIGEPNAMTIATVGKSGRPTARMVLLKGYDTQSFNFFTNSCSTKGQDIEANPYAALVFFWEKLNRSVRVEGRVEKMPDQSIDDYFAQRPRPSQLAAHVSEHQSSPIASRDVLLKRFSSLEEKYKDQESVPRPKYWCGYMVKPDKIEFWQGQSTRMHDRIVFCKDKDGNADDWISGEEGWFYQRLEP